MPDAGRMPNAGRPEPMPWLAALVCAVEGSASTAIPREVPAAALEQPSDGVSGASQVANTHTSVVESTLESGSSKASGAKQQEGKELGPKNSWMLLLAPTDCEEHPRARRVLDRIASEDNPIEVVEYVDVRQSMRNGGGPACLRLRVALTDAELAAVHPGVLLDEARFDELESWVDRNYRESLAPADLADPALVTEVDRAMDELSGLLGLELGAPSRLAEA